MSNTIAYRIPYDCIFDIIKYQIILIPISLATIERQVDHELDRIFDECNSGNPSVHAAGPPTTFTATLSCDCYRRAHPVLSDLQLDGQAHSERQLPTRPTTVYHEVTDVTVTDGVIIMMHEAEFVHWASKAKNVPPRGMDPEQAKADFLRRLGEVGAIIDYDGPCDGPLAHRT